MESKESDQPRLGSQELPTGSNEENKLASILNGTDEVIKKENDRNSVVTRTTEQILSERSKNTKDRHYSVQLSKEFDNLQGYDRQYKIILLGPSSSGKTSLLVRFIDDEFDEKTLNTIGIELKSMTLKVEDQAVRLQIWDTQGQEKYLSLTRQYFRGCSGAVIVFDLTNRKSLESIEQFVENFKSECSTEAAENMVLVGNKNDKDDKREVMTEEGQAASERFGCIGYYETSASTGENVNEAFFSVATKAFKTEEEQRSLAGPQESRSMSEVDEVERRQSIANYKAFYRTTTNLDRGRPKRSCRC